MYSFQTHKLVTNNRLTIHATGKFILIDHWRHYHDQNVVFIQNTAYPTAIHFVSFSFRFTTFCLYYPKIHTSSIIMAPKQRTKLNFETTSFKITNATSSARPFSSTGNTIAPTAGNNGGKKSKKVLISRNSHVKTSLHETQTIDNYKNFLSFGGTTFLFRYATFHCEKYSKILDRYEASLTNYGVGRLCQDCFKNLDSGFIEFQLF